MEKRVYEILATRLPAATVMSMTHRPVVAQYHARRWTMLTSEDERRSRRHERAGAHDNHRPSQADGKGHRAHA